MTDSILDPDAIDRLREWGGAALPQKMIQIFLETTPDRMDQVRAGLDAGDPRQVELGAHSLKSSAGNVGALDLQEAAKTMEILASNRDLEGSAGQLERLEGAFGSAREALELLLDGMET